VKGVWLLALNDLRLTTRDRPAFLWLVAMPIAMMWLFGGIGGDGPASPRIVLTVDNLDEGWLGQALVEGLEDEQIVLRSADSPEVEEDGPVRTLVIPRSFTDGVVAREQQVLRLEKQPDSNAEYGVAAQVHVTRAIVRALGRVIELQGEETLASGNAGERFRELGEQPSLVRLETSTAGAGRPVPGGVRQSVPGILTFIVLMMTLIYGGVFLTIEKESGMLKRQATLPFSRRSIFLGKLLGRLLLALAQIMLLTLAGRFLFGVSWGNSPVGLALVLVSFAIAVAAMSTLLGAVLRTPAQASSVGWILAMVLAALGGCWWPSEVMPDWMRSVGLLLPTGWAMEAFHSLISFGQGLEAVLLPSAVLLGFGALFSVLGGRLLRYG
jgi:ABC-type Na+ efflux pump permease subunit